MEKTYKLFISQPMNGLTSKEILEERERIRKDVESRFSGNIELIDSFFGEAFAKNADNAANPPVYYLGASIQKLANADIAWFGKGWDTARGCKIEHHVALAYNIPNIITENSDYADDTGNEIGDN